MRTWTPTWQGDGLNGRLLATYQHLDQTNRTARPERVTQALQGAVTQLLELVPSCSTQDLEDLGMLVEELNASLPDRVNRTPLVPLARALASNPNNSVWGLDRVAPLAPAATLDNPALLLAAASHPEEVGTFNQRSMWAFLQLSTHTDAQIRTLATILLNYRLYSLTTLRVPLYNPDLQAHLESLLPSDRHIIFHL